MATFVDGVWTFTAPECPTCTAVRRAQRFNVQVDESKPLCSSCSETKALHDYMNSSAYQTWLQSIPAGLSVSEQTAWIAANPPPKRE